MRVLGLGSLYIFVYALSLIYFCFRGDLKMRAASEVNWTKEWQERCREYPETEDGMMHIVILPNYQEDEQMLSQTLSNLGKSIFAQSHMIVVLGMEAREGQDGREK